MMHCNVLFLEVDQESRRKTMTHDLSIVSNSIGVISKLYLSSKGTQHDGLHVGHREPVGPQVTQILKIND